jgi:hypothetical protein
MKKISKVAGEAGTNAAADLAGVAFGENPVASRLSDNLWIAAGRF